MEGTIEVSDVIISKPKKSENSFLCSLYHKNKPHKPMITMSSTLIVGTKPLSQRNEYFVYMKNKVFNNFFYDLNQHITEVVRDKCGMWFNNNINPDLIEDLYTNTLVYDRKHGDIIRVKCVDSNEHTINDLMNQKVDVQLAFTHLRFYKQKFLLECEITSCEPKECDIDCEDESQVPIFDDELPAPTYEDLTNIKQECCASIDEYASILETDLKALQSRFDHIKTLRKEIVDTVDIENISRVWTEFEKLRE